MHFMLEWLTCVCGGKGCLLIWQPLHDYAYRSLTVMASTLCLPSLACLPRGGMIQQGV